MDFQILLWGQWIFIFRHQGAELKKLNFQFLNDIWRIETCRLRKVKYFIEFSEYCEKLFRKLFNIYKWNVLFCKTICVNPYFELNVLLDFYRIIIELVGFLETVKFLSRRNGQYSLQSYKIGKATKIYYKIIGVKELCKLVAIILFDITRLQEVINLTVLWQKLRLILSDIGCKILSKGDKNFVNFADIKSALQCFYSILKSKNIPTKPSTLWIIAHSRINSQAHHVHFHPTKCWKISVFLKNSSIWSKNYRAHIE